VEKNPVLASLFLIALLARALTAASVAAAELPSDLKEAMQKLGLDAATQKAWLRLPESHLYEILLIQLAQMLDGAKIVLSHLPHEAPPTQLRLLEVMGSLDYWAQVEGVDAVLRSLADSTENGNVAIAAADTIRILAIRRERATVRHQIMAAKLAGDAKACAILFKSDESLGLEISGIHLAASQLQVPAPFPVMPAGQPVHFVGLGDFGDGSLAQKKVAAAMLKVHREVPFDFGVTFGDNIRPTGRSLPMTRDFTTGGKQYMGRSASSFTQRWETMIGMPMARPRKSCFRQGVPPGECQPSTTPILPAGGFFSPLIRTIYPKLSFSGSATR